MAITITAKLNKAANEFQAGESTGFGLRLGVQYYDRESKQKEWTNYECVIFAKAEGQVNFYRDALIEGAIIEITGQQAKIKKFEDYLSIELIDAKLGYVGQGVSSNQKAVNQGQKVAQQQVQPVNQFDSNGDGFDDTIPF